MWFYSWVYWPGAVSGLVGGYLIDRVFGARLGIAVFSGLLALGQVFYDFLVTVKAALHECVNRTGTP